VDDVLHMMDRGQIVEDDMVIVDDFRVLAAGVVHPLGWDL